VFKKLHKEKFRNKNTDISNFYAMSKMINEETFSRDKSGEHEDNLPPSMVEVKNA